MKKVSKLGSVEQTFIRDVVGTQTTIVQLAKKYGVSRQSIYVFIQQKGIKRLKREHIEKCSICQDLIRIAKKPHSDFLSSQTIREQLGLGRVGIAHHIRILRSKGLVSQKFGRLRSRRAERAYQIYFKKRLPVRMIGKHVGLRNFWSIIKRHRDLGWDVPAPLFTYNSRDRRKSAAKRVKRKGAE